MSAPKISREELLRRIKALADKANNLGYDAIYLTKPTNIFYLTNVSVIPTERPFSVIIDSDRNLVAFSPYVEKDHLEYRNSLAGNIISQVYYYFDYPGKKHPMNVIKELIKKEVKPKAMFMDNLLGANPIWGYSSPNLSELLSKEGIRTGNVEGLIDEMRLFKSSEEIELIKESAYWASKAIENSIPLLEENRWDWEIAFEASRKTIYEMNEKYKPYIPLRGPIEPIVGFRGQVGEFSSYPHALVSERPLRKGDVLGIGSGPEIGGYFAELERTLIFGKNEKVATYFNKMLKLREEAFNLLTPGRKVSEIDGAVRKKAKEIGVDAFLKHHTGHGIGLEGHEPPLLDVGYDFELKPGVVITIEPGIYNKYGGFRHSDTVLITKSGFEMLTRYPDHQ
ncbi:MAG: Xaa-Pro peptidase family protein [Caldisphaeraceae archaeon]|nr:Xaa-Pro peptidase family protein [Caldisphaeraceae archaeon]